MSLCEREICDISSSSSFLPFLPSSEERFSVLSNSIPSSPHKRRMGKRKRKRKERGETFWAKKKKPRETEVGRHENMCEENRKKRKIIHLFAQPLSEERKSSRRANGKKGQTRRESAGYVHTQYNSRLPLPLKSSSSCLKFVQNSPKKNGELGKLLTFS